MKNTKIVEDAIARIPGGSLGNIESMKVFLGADFVLGSEVTATAVGALIGAFKKV